MPNFEIVMKSLPVEGLSQLRHHRARSAVVRSLSATLAVSALVWVVTPDAAAGVIKFEKIADFNTLIPNGAGKFTGFGDPPVISEGLVAFTGLGQKIMIGQNNVQQEGVYSGKAGAAPVRVADLKTAVPKGVGNFTSFRAGLQRLSIRDDIVAFQGLSGIDNATRGIYTFTASGGNGAKVVATGDARPEGGQFAGAVDTWLSAGDVAFRGIGMDGKIGIYTNAGFPPLRTIADQNTKIGATNEKFKELLAPSYSDGKVVFLGLDQNLKRGLYADKGMTVVVDASFDIPGLGGKFDEIGRPAFDGTLVAFQGRKNANEQGVYTNKAGGNSPIVRTVADTMTKIKDYDVNGLGLFTSFGDPALDGGNVAFLGFGNPNPDNVPRTTGIYAKFRDSQFKFVDFSDTLPGVPAGFSMSQLGLSNQGLSGKEITFFAQFAKNDDPKKFFQGVYVATLTAVPEPASWLLLATGLAGLVFQRRGGGKPCHKATTGLTYASAEGRINGQL